MPASLARSRTGGARSAYGEFSTDHDYTDDAPCVCTTQLTASSLLSSPDARPPDFVWPLSLTEGE